MFLFSRFNLISTAMTLWIVLGYLGVGFLMKKTHLPLKSSELTHSFPSSNQWQLIHVLSRECDCSKEVFRQIQLRQSKLGADWNEKVIWLEEQGAREWVDRHFKVSSFPFLVVVKPTGQVSYMGGYAATRPSRWVRIQVDQIIHQIQKEIQVRPFPIYGCYESKANLHIAKATGESL